jgi:poly(3-hydroxybutyrate) depolymerase
MAPLFGLVFCALLALAVPLATAQRRASGCGTTSSSSIQNGKSANISIESGGLHRSYLLHIPKSYHSSTPVALILSFHGRTRDAKQQEELSQLSNPSFNPDWIAVYPQGVAVNIADVASVN